MQAFRSFAARYPKLFSLLLVLAWISQGVQMILYFQPTPGPSVTAMEIAAVCNMIIAQFIALLVLLVFLDGTPFDPTSPIIHDGNIYLLFYFTAASVLRSPFLHSTEKSTVDAGLALELLLALAGALLCAFYFLCKSLVWFVEGVAKEITEEPAQSERKKLEFRTAKEMRRRVKESTLSHDPAASRFEPVIPQLLDNDSISCLETSLQQLHSARLHHSNVNALQSSKSVYRHPFVVKTLKAMGYAVTIDKSRNAVAINFRGVTLEESYDNLRALGCNVTVEGKDITIDL